MSETNKQSRSNKFEKRRKNTKRISILIIAGSILVLILLGMWIFGGKDEDISSPDNDSSENGNMEVGEDHNSIDQENNDSEASNESENQSNAEFGNDVTDEDIEINEATEDEQNERDEEVDTQQVESSDENVIVAYTGNWQPIGTIQEGPHTTNYDNGSQDRIEIKQAVMAATGLGEDMTEHWVGNGGDQKVIATVSERGAEEIYRVYLSWIDQEGWQVTKVERLKEVS